MDQLNKHDDLKRKISGLDSSDEEGDSEYDDDTDIIRHATEALDDIKSSIQNTDNDIPAKGVMSMKFMKRALDAQKLEAERAVDQLREDMLNERMDSDDDNEHNHQALSKGTLISSGNVGRQVFSVNVFRKGGNTGCIILANDDMLFFVHRMMVFQVCKTRKNSNLVLLVLGASLA